jgi:hypothetical protein
MKPARVLGPAKTPTQTRENPYPGHGCGFRWVGVRVAWEYPRVTRDNPYIFLRLLIHQHVQ